MQVNGSTNKVLE